MEMPEGGRRQEGGGDEGENGAGQGVERVVGRMGVKSEGIRERRGRRGEREGAEAEKKKREESRKP